MLIVISYRSGKNLLKLGVQIVPAGANHFNHHQTLATAVNSFAFETNWQDGSRKQHCHWEVAATQTGMLQKRPIILSHTTRHRRFCN